MKIENFAEIAKTEERKHALEIVEAGFAAVDTQAVVSKNVSLRGDQLSVHGSLYPLSDADRIFVVGVGKCALEAAVALESILGDRLSGGIVLDVRTDGRLAKIESYKGSHPLPSAENREVTGKIVALLKSLGERDLVLFVVSGGGSTLLHSPKDLSDEEEARIVKSLFKEGATIQEINTIRKHISYARGGFLAKYAYPARGIALIFSDVPSNDVQFIASGPTIKDTTTIKEAEAVLGQYDVLQTCGIKRCGLIETPKDDKYFEFMRNIIVVTNETALEAMATQARRMGFAPRITTSKLTGEAREVGRRVVNQLSKEPRGTVLLYGGETTVTIHGTGTGGRNQELVLSALSNVVPGQLVVSVASDGRDNTDAAGALCDTITKERAESLGLDAEEYLAQNASYAFFRRVGDAIITGDTGSNVSDLVVAFVT